MNNSILIVDDDPNVLSSLKRTLKKEPYEIHTAESGVEGLKILKDIKIKLVISTGFRLAFMLILMIAIEGLAIFLSWKFGKGENLFQKITSSWGWPTFGFAIVALSFPFIMGRKRMQLLKFWKGDDK